MDKREEKEDSPTAQWERETVTGHSSNKILMHSEEYRIYVSCASEISYAHFCVNLRLSAVYMHLVYKQFAKPVAVEWYKYTLNNLDREKYYMKYYRFKNMYEKASTHYTNHFKIISQAHSL